MIIDEKTEKSLVSFDYAIKYLLRDKGNYEIVEGFISALLKSMGYKGVKILSLLESESNKENSKSKRSLADLVVEDEDHHKYIIEIERSFTYSFVHKSLFNTSRVIVDNLAEGVDYTKILKVFHISLLYFKPSAKNIGPIYHGKTIIRETESKEKLSIHLANEETGEQYDASNIMPEYFYISIPSFNDRIEKEIDEWLHVMKHNEIPENYESPYMKQVAEKLSVLKMSQEERDHYFYYQKKLHTDREEIVAATDKGVKIGMEKGMEKGIKKGMEKGIEKGIKKGIEKGARQRNIEIAKKMLHQRIDDSVIESITGLSKEDLSSLKEK